MKNSKAKGTIEAILFAVGNSVKIERLSQVLEMPEKKIKDLLKEMKKEYEAEERGIELIYLNDSVQLGTKNDTYEYLAKIAKTPQKYVLTDTVLETLSIIAYKQPVTRGEIEKIRGVSCDHAINKLIEYELIEEVGRLDAPGKPLLFGTTEQFLRSFGVTSIGDLPQVSAEIQQNFEEQAKQEAYEQKEDADDSEEDEIIDVDI